MEFRNSMFYEDINGNKYGVTTVAQLERSIKQDKFNDWDEVTQDFIDSIVKFDSDPNVTEYFTKFGRFVLDSIAHIPDAKAVYHSGNGCAYVYVPNDVFVIGELTLDERQVFDSTTGAHTHTDYTYKVESPLICNKRFCPYNSKIEYRTVESKRYEKAVSNARKYLRPNTLADIVRCTFRDLATEFGKIVDNQRDKVNKLCKKMGAGKVLYGRTDLADEIPILAEMMRMQDQGVKFLDPVLADNLSKYREEIALLVEVGAQDEMYACFIRDNHRGETVVDYHDVKIQAPYSALDTPTLDPYNTKFLTDGSYNIPVEKLDEDLSNKMASLSIVDNGEFVRGVGYKYTENIYYVTK